MSQDFEANDPASAELTPSAETRKSGPRLKIPVPPDLPHDDPEHGSPHRRLSTMVGVNFLLLLVLIVMLGLMLFQQRNAPATAGTSGAAGPEDSKALGGEVDRLKTEIAGLTKKLGETTASGDTTSQIKSLDDKVADLYKSLSETPARLEALNQKIETAVKNEAFAPAPKVEAIEKKVGELTQAIDSLKAALADRPAPAAAPAAAIPATAAQPAEAGGENQAMALAVDLFKKGKYLEAKEAFGRLQSSTPDDARVWYYSALANGLATRDWKGESERLVNSGVAKEKAGSPDKARIDAAFADLTETTGKAWLNYYRGRAAQ